MIDPCFLTLSNFSKISNKERKCSLRNCNFLEGLTVVEKSGRKWRRGAAEAVEEGPCKVTLGSAEKVRCCLRVVDTAAVWMTGRCTD